MTFESGSAIMTKDTSFDSVLNSACQKLLCLQAQYTIRRIQELDEELDRIENDLDEFLSLAVSAKMPLEK